MFIVNVEAAMWKNGKWLIIERSKKEVLMWFRREFDEHINWAGNPEKNIDVISKDGVEIQYYSLE